MKFIPGQIVRHKLTKEKMLILSVEGCGASLISKQRVRTEKLEELLLDTDELEEFIEEN